MVTIVSKNRQRGALATEAVIALGILVVVMIPLSFAFRQEAQLCRAYYYKAAAMEIIDGEMEVLVAGEWRAFQSGRQNFTTRAASARRVLPDACGGAREAGVDSPGTQRRRHRGAGGNA
jgi:hypothetical protein